MHTDPVAFLREDFPRLFNDGVAALQREAEAGDEAARERHEDTTAARGCSRFVLEGEGGGEIYLAVEGGTMRALSDAPDGLPLRMAVAAPAAAARAGLEELEELGVIDEDTPLTRLALLASARTQKVLDGHELLFHLTLRDLPADPEEVTLRVAVGGGEPPAEPAFTVAVSYDDLEDVRNGDMTPQQLLGRMKMAGDYSKALGLAMSMVPKKKR